jgi:hypothetical protein
VRELRSSFTASPALCNKDSSVVALTMFGPL